MRRSHSGPVNGTRRELFGRPEGLQGSATPGYSGHIPGIRHEDATYGHTFNRSVEAAQGIRSRSTFSAQTMRLDRDESERRLKSTAPVLRAPPVDKRGISYPAAGDTQHSRIRASNEEKDPTHFHSSMGLTSMSHEDRGAAEKLRGYGRAARGVPGYCGYVPGKHAENVYADTWSKTHEKSLGAHFGARMKAPKKWGLLSESGTMVHPVASDTLAEQPIFNPSYHDRVRGWNTSHFTGTHIDPAGRLAPRDRQEGYNCQPPPAPNVAVHGYRGAAIHGYAGWVPGRAGDSVVGERQCKTNAVADHITRKNQMRITQR